MIEKKEEDNNSDDELNLVSKIFGAFKNFGDAKFKIQKTQFSITKLPPMAGFKVSEKLRVTLAITADKFDAGSGKKSDSESANLFFKAILGLPTEFIEYLQDELFEHVQFNNAGSEEGVKKGWAPLKGMEDMAYQDFEVINMYEVLGRALCVNFQGSFSGILSRFPGMEQLITLFLQKT